MANLFDLPEPVPQPSPTGTPPPAVGPVNLFDIPEPGTPSLATDELEQAAQAGSAALIDYAAKHPELDYDAVFARYRDVAKREQESLSIVDNPSAPLQVAKGLAGGLAELPGSFLKAAKGATEVAVQQIAGDDAQKNAAIVEGVAAMEAGTYKTWDVLRHVLRKAVRSVGGTVRANFGGELSEEDLRKRFDGDLQSMNRINKAVAVEDSMAADLAKGLGVAPGEINRERIQEVSEWTDLTMLVPFGFGAKTAEKGVVKGLLRKGAAATVDTALHQLEKLGTEAAAKAAKAGATEATQQAAKRSPLLASAIAAGTTFATTGDPMWAAISALAGHQIAGKRGLATAVARKSIRPLAQFGTKALEITKPVYRSAMGGMVGMAPFAFSAETPEEFGAILGTGAGVGVVGGSLHFAQDKLTPGSFFRTERPKTDLPKMEVLNFGTDPEADFAHRRAVSGLDNESHNFVETIRQYVKEQTGREVYVLEGADFDKVAADFGKPNRVQGFVTPDGLQSFLRVDKNAFGHEAIGHLWFEALDPQSQKEILDGVQKYYRPEDIATFQKEYTDKLAKGIMLSQYERGEAPNVDAARAEAARIVGAEGYVPREIIAENASAILSSIPPSQFGQPLPFVRGLHLKMEGLAERLGLRNETSVPQTNLGITPSARLADVILNEAAASRLEADMTPADILPDAGQPPVDTPVAAEMTQGMRLFPAGVNVTAGDGTVIGTDAVVKRTLGEQDGVTYYEVEYTDPTTGERTTSSVPESNLSAPAKTPATPTPAPVQPAVAPQAAPAAKPANPGTVEWPVDTGFEPGRPPEPLRPGQPAARPVEKPISQPAQAAQPPIGENQRRTGAQLNRLIGLNERLSAAVRQDIRTAVETNGGNEAVMTNTYAAIQEAVKGGRENTPALRLKMRVAEADAGRVNPLTREREQLQRDAGTRGEVVEEKLIVPFGVPVLSKKGTLTFTGFDLSRPFDTADRLFRFAQERGFDLPYSRVDDPQLTTDLAAYTQNHANGYLGDGRAFPANLAARLEIRPTKGYTPVPISRERSQFLNILMGNLNTSSERALSTARAVGGQAFQIDPAGTKFETNPLRYRLRELGAPAELLANRSRNSATAVFRLDRIDSVEGATDLGFRQPNTLAVEAGFMPEVFENQEVPGMPLRYRGVWELAPGRRMRMFDALKDITDAAGRVLVGKFSTVDSSTLERIGFEFPELSDEPMQRREYSAFSPETPEFKAWFGDSKVVDEEGKPLKMYHGTSSEFSIFDPQQGGKNFGQKEPYVFLTSSREDGDLYARNSARKGGTPRTLSLFVKLENPYVIEENSDSAGIHTLFENRRGLKQEVVEALNSPEYDGVLVRDAGSRLYGEDDKLRVETIAIAKHPEQIKSATGNRGTYDPKNPDIRYMPETAEFEKPAGADTVNPDEWFTPEEAARVKAAGFDLVEAARIRAAAAGALERSKATRNPGAGGRVVGVDTPAGESQADTVQFARKEGPLAESVRLDAPLKLIHWSGNAGLSRLDPAKLGKGLATARDRRGEPRTYFYVQGSEYGADAGLVNGAGKNVYGATVAPDRIYDGDADPLGYYEQPNREKADALLRDNGYAGIATTTPDNRRVVEMYEPVDVKPLGNDQSRFAPTAEDEAAVGVAPLRTQKFESLADAPFSGEAYQALRNTAAEVFRSLGLRTREADAVGGWVDTETGYHSRETSLRATTNDRAKARLAGALLGVLAPDVQNAVYFADYRQDAPHHELELSFDSLDDLQVATDKLSEHGLPGYTAIPDKNQLIVALRDVDSENNARKFLETLDRDGTRFDRAFTKADIQFPETPELYRILEEARLPREDGAVRKNNGASDPTLELIERALKRRDVTAFAPTPFPEENRLTRLRRGGPAMTRILEENPGFDPDQPAVTVYRATIGDKIRPNDYVALNRAVAENHLGLLEDRGERGRVVTERVAPGDLLMANDATEFVYSPTRDRTAFAPESPEFKKWFGDSKVIDENGEPLRVFHGTEDARGFASGKGFSYSFKRDGEHGDTQLGFFFGGKQAASRFAGDYQNSALLPAYLKLENPKEVSGAEYVDRLRTMPYRDWKKWKKDLIKEGYDGLVIRTDTIARYSEFGDQFLSDNYVAFDPKQIRSALEPSDPKNYSAFAPENLSTVPILEGREPAKLIEGATAIGRHLADRSRKQARVPFDSRTPKARDSIATALADELQYSMTRDKSGIGWYEAKVSEALDTISEIHPEIKEDPNAKSIYTAILAITSNGQKVVDNFRRAEEVYSGWKDSGKIDSLSDWGGARRDGINAGLSMLQYLLDTEGAAGTREFLQTEFRFGDLKKAAKQRFGLELPSSELADTVVNGSIIFGPKVGGGFYQNLNGNFRPITMDLWLMRTWNRINGSYGVPDKEGIARGLERVRAAAQQIVDSGDSNPEYQTALDLLKMSDQKLLNWSDKRYTDWERVRKFKNPTPLDRPAKNVSEARDGAQESPRNGNERAWVRKVFGRVDEVLKERGLPVINNADKQALLWYYEKELYARHGYKEKSNAGQLDYADAARLVVESRRKQGAGGVGRDALEFDVEPAGAVR